VTPNALPAYREQLDQKVGALIVDKGNKNHKVALRGPGKAEERVARLEHNG
jgi:hypothetical protein